MSSIAVKLTEALVCYFVSGNAENKSKADKGSPFFHKLLGLLVPLTTELFDCHKKLVFVDVIVIPGGKVVL